MSVYLKRLQLTDVEEYEYDPSVYVKRVNIVEVVDENGDPWTPPTEIGTVTVNPDNISVAAMGSKSFSVVVTGGDATDLRYKWNVRSGAAQLDTSDHLPTVTYTFLAAGTAQIQCVVSSNNSTNSPQSNLAFVLVS